MNRMNECLELTSLSVELALVDVAAPEDCKLQHMTWCQNSPPVLGHVLLQTGLQAL